MHPPCNLTYRGVKYNNHSATVTTSPISEKARVLAMERERTFIKYRQVHCLVWFWEK